MTHLWKLSFLSHYCYDFMVVNCGVDTLLLMQTVVVQDHSFYELISSTHLRCSGLWFKNKILCFHNTIRHLAVTFCEPFHTSHILKCCLSKLESSYINVSFRSNRLISWRHQKPMIFNLEILKILSVLYGV